MSTTVEEIEKTKTSQDELLLDSLEIKGYRCFEHLTIEKLGRVNLIVGKNNVGKTALLEALWIYANGGDFSRFYQILRSRQESSKFENNGDSPTDEDFWASRYLLSDRPSLKNQDTEVPLTISIGTLEYNSPVEIVISPASPREVPKIHSTQSYFFRLISYFVQTSKMSSTELERLWNNIELTIFEDEVLSSLKLLFPKLIKVRLKTYTNKVKSHIVVAQIKDIFEPVPLRSLGEGVSRLFEISLALVNCRSGLLLIDEIENGLHYSVLQDVWKLIFKTAKDLNVQVFATTHSKDCIEAFTQAAIDDEESDGMLIRLENKDGKIRAVNFNEDELETVERRNIEVR